MKRDGKKGSKRGSKKALTLLEFVIDLIVAVICIIILFYLSAAIYGMFFGGKQKLQATGQLEEILEAIEASQSSVNGKAGFMLQNPNAWFFISTKQGNENAELPVACKNAECIAVCPGKKLTEKLIKWDWGMADCKKGVYKNIDNPLLFNDELVFMKIEGVKDMCIQYKTDSYQLTEEKCAEVSGIQPSTKRAEEVLAVMEKVKDPNPAVEGRNCKCGAECGAYAEWISKYSGQYGTDTIIVLSIMMQESSCDKTAKSSAGACGLMQLHPPEFCDLPEKNIEKGIAKLDAAIETCNSLETALGRYFTGQCSYKLEYSNDVIARYNELKKILQQVQAA